MSSTYYDAPPHHIFDELKVAAIETWNEVAHDHRYAEEKIEHVNQMANISDNFMTIFAMFDHGNQRICGEKLSPACKMAINERLISGGSEYAMLEM